MGSAQLNHQFGFFEGISRTLFGKSDIEVEMEQQLARQKRQLTKDRSGLLGDTYNIDNSGNILYAYTLYMGQQQTAVEVAFDTGSSWLGVAAYGCVDYSLLGECTDGAKFDYSRSNTF